MPEDVITVEDLTKRYGETLAVDRISFAAPRGATVGLLGGNGAGKTTTIAMLLGLLVPTGGRIRILGHDIARDRFAALARMNFSSPYVALPHRLTVAEIMTHFPVTIGPDQALTEAASRMLLHNVQALPVTENRRLVGILTRTHLLYAFIRSQAAQPLAA